MSYRRGKDNVIAEFLSPLSLPRTEEGISGSCALLDLDDLGVYFIRACGFIPSFYPIPGIGLGEMASPSPTIPSSDVGGRISQPDPLILGGLSLTHADFAPTVTRTHHHT